MPSNKQFFRSIDQLAGTDAANEFLEREFPAAASEFPEGVSRRRWVQIMSASIAFAGAAGCRYQKEEFAAFVVPPEGRVAGLPQRFATNFEWAGRVVNALVSSFDGRPIKIDGNAQHPMFASSAGSGYADDKDAKFALAGSDVFTQAAVLSLYDPDRIGAVVNRTKSDDAVAMVTVASAKNRVDWTSFDTFVVRNAKLLEQSQGDGLAIVYEPSKSPTLNRLLAETAKKLSKATFVRYDSVYQRNAQKGLEAAGGGKASVHYRLDQAKVILSIDCDLFSGEPDAVVNARQFAKNRNPEGGNMNRLYCVEAQYSVTGTAADFRYALQSSQMISFLRRLEAAIDAGQLFEVQAGEKNYSELSPAEKLERVVQVVATDLLNNKGNSLVCVGYHQDPGAHQIAMRLNAKLENVGKTLMLLDIPDELSEVQAIKLNEFVDRASEFKQAWILAPNPVYTVPGDIKLADALKSIETVIYPSDYDDETAVYATWTLPLAHPLEAWSDVRSSDGTYGVGQPMIAPVTGARSMIELLSIMAGFTELGPQKIVQATCQSLVGGSFSDRMWQQMLHDGFLSDSAAQPANANIAITPEDAATVTYKLERNDGESGDPLAGGAVTPDILASNPDDIDTSKLEVLILPSSTVYDGRLANNGWLQECPHPISKLTWDNAALMSIATARKLGVKQSSEESEIVVIRQGEATAKVPVFVVPGMAEGTIVIATGYGRTRAGTVGGLEGSFDVGHSVQSLRRWNQAFILNSGVSVSGTSRQYRLATTQDHFAIADQIGMAEIPKRADNIVREGTLAAYEKNQKFAQVHLHHPPESLWEEPDVAQGHKWGMTIDLNKCTGCSACVIACQAENNVPIVGKEQVARGREMHWLRIDRYFAADNDATKAKGDFTDPVEPRIVTQPMACVHCETAPCEQVCPVAATVHTDDGINTMAYNRCIGTRYCANNCPYKVRRFNYFNFNQKYGYFYGWSDSREKVNTKLQSLVLNPDVTVRGRGVMEKCTYCIQRVQNGKIAARNRGDGTILDGDVQSACQQACPTQAIVFGDLLDKTSRVYANQQNPRAYSVLEELNVKPRTQYLARVRNVPARLMTTVQLREPEEHSAGHDAHGSADAHGAAETHEEHNAEHAGHTE